MSDCEDYISFAFRRVWHCGFFGVGRGSSDGWILFKAPFQCL